MPAILTTVLFCSPTNQSNEKPTFKSFHHYLTEPYEESFLISTCAKTKILKIISSLDSNKATEINSISIKILQLAKEQIAEHLRFIYNISFTTSIFQTFWKLLKSHQFTKDLSNFSVLTIDLSLCYQILMKQ